MAAKEGSSDIIVGIDFGMTCTGVAYSWGPDWLPPKTIQHWPGKMINELANKVPTLLQYEDDDSHIVKAWGFKCDEGNEEVDVISCFKLHMDPSFDDSQRESHSLAQARQWFRDYICCIYGHIDEMFTSLFPLWKAQRVEFIFSVPTTWKHPTMIAELEILIRNAGFGKGGSNHHAEIGLTEAEAAAVYASRLQFQKNEVMIICDAGGGTTDLNVLRLDTSKGEPTRLHQLSWVEGSPVGSTLIDMEFHRVISARLSKIKEHLQGNPEDIAAQMMDAKFEGMKCTFGTVGYSRIPIAPFSIPSLAPGHNFPDSHIEDSKMICTWEELRDLFDKQVSRIIKLIDEQLEIMRRTHPRVQISYLVLSGGLGSSPYIGQRLKLYYKAGLDTSGVNAIDMKIVIVDEPQISVVHGLVIDRIQTVRWGEAMFKNRCCRLSYGVLSMEQFNPNNPAHSNQPVTKDARDEKQWVKGQIEWLVRQGDTISSAGILKPMTVKVKPGNEGTTWRTFIVMSGSDRKSLPTNISQPGVTQLCSVSSVLKNQGLDMKLKNRRWYSRGDKYLRVNFDLRVILGAADLRFELVNNNERVFSNAHNPIEVKWEPPVLTEENEKICL